MIKKILIAILLLALLPHAAGFEGYAGQDVVISAYLIEMRCNASDDAAVVTETIVFRNNGDANRSDDLRIVVSEGARIMQVQKKGMGYGDNATVMPITYELDGEILRWNATIEPGAMPTMYAITYAVPVNASGFVKKFFYPAVVTYPIGQLRLKIDTDSYAKLTDELGNALEPDETNQEDVGGVLYAWSGPVAFKELHIELSQPSQPSNADKWIVYALIALLLLAALTYPVIHVRNAKLREKEGGAKFSCASCTVCEKGDEEGVCDGERGDEGGERGGDWDEMDGIITELTLKKDDLMRKKKAILAVLNKMEEDHDAGAISDADYKRLSSKYERQAIEIMKQLDKM